VLSTTVNPSVDGHSLTQRPKLLMDLLRRVSRMRRPDPLRRSPRIRRLDPSSRSGRAVRRGVCPWRGASSPLPPEGRGSHAADPGPRGRGRWRDRGVERRGERMGRGGGVHRLSRSAEGDGSGTVIQGWSATLQFICYVTNSRPVGHI